MSFIEAFIEQLMIVYELRFSVKKKFLSGPPGCRYEFIFIVKRHVYVICSWIVAQPDIECHLLIQSGITKFSYLYYSRYV